MAREDIDAYIVPTADPHQSEYVADHYKSRIWITGFTGSAGTAVITHDRAIIWADGRYFTQAEKEIEDSEFELFKIATPGYPNYKEWLAETMEAGGTLGFDGRLLSQKIVEELEAKLRPKKIDFKKEQDLIDEIWEDRSEIPRTEVFIHSLDYAGYSPKEKLEQVREVMREKEQDYFLISGLDDIAWLLNIRARDIECNPVTISYALVGLEEAYLCIDDKKLNREVRQHLEENGIEIRDYKEIIELVEDIDPSSRVILDKSKINTWLYTALDGDIEVLDETDITTNIKAIKNKTEIENQKNAYIKDGVAMTKLFYWIDKNKEVRKISELDTGEKLEEIRRNYDDYIEPSFPHISAYGENAAMMHYEPAKDNYSILENKGLYLLDTGGQYLDGTTDTTRTIALGELTDEEKKDFTYVLKSHINLISAKFLEGTKGYQLDAICRYPLWQIGSDYKCGTGHGVGYLLNVHEGPHNISTKKIDVALKEGMVATIEPGVYKPGKHGIRLENVVVVKEDIKTDSGQFLSFETLSFVPIDLNCIDPKYLSQEEIIWLNSYHDEVYEKLSPYLSKEENIWLKGKTKSI